MCVCEHTFCTGLRWVSSVHTAKTRQDIRNHNTNTPSGLSNELAIRRSQIQVPPRLTTACIRLTPTHSTHSVTEHVVLQSRDSRTRSLRAWVTVSLVFPPFMIMAFFTFSVSLGSLFCRKRLERLVFGFLTHKIKIQSDYRLF